MYDVIIRDSGEIEILLLENGILVERILQKENQENIEGNIYIGKVQNVLTGMQAAFINIGENKNAFIHLKDLLPKKDISSGKLNIDKFSIKEIIKPGNPILVQVKRAESNKKGAKVSTHISLSGNYTVLLPNTNIITASQKIENINEIERLKSEIKSLLPNNFGAIIRTSAIRKRKSYAKRRYRKPFKRMGENYI